MSICVWMFSESDIESVSNASKIKGILVEISGNSGKTMKTSFLEHGIDMSTI